MHTLCSEEKHDEYKVQSSLQLTVATFSETATAATTIGVKPNVIKSSGTLPELRVWTGGPCLPHDGDASHVDVLSLLA